MVYLFGGYLVTRDQVLQWCLDHNLGSPCLVNTTFVVDDWLREQHIPSRLRGVTYRRQDWYLLITARRKDARATFTKFKPLKEDDHALSIKTQMNMGDVEFVTIPNSSPDGY
jgi:hypothetical protein